MANGSNENKGELKIYQILVPLLIGILIFVISIASFLLTRWMENIDKKLAAIEEMSKTQIEMKYKIERLEKQLQESNGSSRRENNTIDPITSRMYFVKPDDIKIGTKNNTL